MTATVQVELYAVTDIGLVRASNQDYLIIGSLDSGERFDESTTVHCDVDSRGPIMVVCDGMGGAAGGDVASKLAADVIWGEMRAAQETDERPVYARILRRAVRLANRRVFEVAQRDEKLYGMGTTVSAAGIVGDALILAQVGDSRAYIHRGGTLTQVTRDQSIVSALLHAGRISPLEAETGIGSNMILQALGVRDDLDVSLSIVEIRRGDALLLCSDGLHGPVPDDILRATMASCPDLDEAVATLVLLAKKAGGPDNITAVVARFTGEGLKEPRSPEDLPRFTEFNPMEEGARALTTTSWVARRLAARVGIGEDPGPPVVPATGQHSVYHGDVADQTGQQVPQYEVPAADRLAKRERLGLLAWVLALIAVLAIAGLLLWDRI